MINEFNQNQLRNIYEESIEDIALEISIDKKFRKLLKDAQYGEQIEISSLTARHCKYVSNVLSQGLVFIVEKVTNCPEHFDNGLTIFKFFSRDYPDIIKYTGNNI